MTRASLGAIFSTILSAVVLLGTSGCGVSTEVEDPNLTVEMYGIFEAPSSAEGDSAPRWQTYLLDEVRATYEADDRAGVESVVLKSNLDRTLKILDRPQIIYEKDLSKYDGKRFRSITLIFDPTVVIAGIEKSNHELTLSSGEIVWEGAKKFNEAKGFDLTIKVQWNNTVDTSGTETVSAPEFTKELN
jgi:hypothetical protein